MVCVLDVLVWFEFLGFGDLLGWFGIIFLVFFFGCLEILVLLVGREFGICGGLWGLFGLFFVDIGRGWMWMRLLFLLVVFLLF